MELTKKDVVEALMENDPKLTKAMANRAVNCVFDTIAKNLQTPGDKATFVGFGSFRVQSVAERTGRNPQTGESLTIPAKNTVRFKAGSALKTL